MMTSIRELLSGLFDYAGLFPPASLPLEAAAENYGRYRRGEDAWMLGRFVCPAGQAAALAQWARSSERADRLPVCLLADGQQLADRSAWSDVLAVESIELRLSENLDDDLAGQLQGLPLDDPSVSAIWMEIAPPPPPAVLQAISGLNRGNAPGDGTSPPFRYGYKLRMGGAERDSRPPAAAVADAIAGCREAGLPMKATAGLHEPLPRTGEQTGPAMHGFFNLVLAVSLARHAGLSTGEISELLQEQALESFAVSSGAISWRGKVATAGEIAETRREAFLSIGSCSFDEPRESLRRLDLL